MSVFLYVMGFAFFSMPPVLKDRENDSWWHFSRFIIILKEEDGGETSVVQAYPRFTSTTWHRPPARTPLDERARVPRSRLALRGVARGFLLPGCSCQTQVWTTTDALSRRPASPRASFIQPQNKKSCKWERLP